MYYKNYWISYINSGDEIACAVCDMDMTDFDNKYKDDHNYKHMLYHFPINRFQFEHCRDYLDENGLFMGIFPPEFIENGISEWLDEQKKFRERLYNDYIKDLMNPLDNEFLNGFINFGAKLDDFLYVINSRIQNEQKYYGKILYPLSYYNNYFQKYFGIEDIDEYLNNQHT